MPRSDWLVLAVWGAAAMVSLAAWMFASPQVARAAVVGALFCGLNFSGAIWTLRRLMVPGPGRFVYALLYVTKFSILVCLLALLILHAKWPVEGLLLGLFSLPAATFLLAGWAVFQQFKQRRQFKQQAQRPRE